MAETFLSPVIEKLVDLLNQEVKSLKGVHGEVKILRAELQIINPLLKDAEARREKGDTSAIMMAWLEQLREEASRIEDVIDRYRYHLGRRHNQSGFTSSLRKAGNFIKALKPRHEIASEVESIKQSLNEIKGRGQSYGLKPLEQGSSSATSDIQPLDPRLRSLFTEKDELVGIESASTDLKAKLVEGASARLIISLVGEGGIGKTTLAKNVYDDGAVKKHFESATAWITVSQPFNLMKVLKEMRNEICTSGESLVGENDSVEALINCLRTYLQTKRYVVFFDDVWEQNFWDHIKLALPNNNEGSRVVITTRNSAVANSCKETPYDLVQNLQPWSLKSAWELFCKKAFKYDFQGICPEELRELSLEIIKKCQGLPLVIATIAGLLSTKEKIESEWRKVLDDLNSKVEINSEFTEIQKILSLSYFDLPYSIRSCFLYFGLFPEDYSISDERLTRLWIADGFVKEKREKTLEEVAEEYIGELTKRNLVTLDPWKSIGEGNWFRVHDLMHDVILTRADDARFCQTWDKNKSKSRGKGRRLMISGDTKDVLEIVESSGVRSIFLFDVDAQLRKCFMVNLFKKFKLLEVLDVDNAPVDSLPKELGKLFCLKYLSLRNTRVKMLPKSISKLHNLESLDIRDSLICELPKEINKLTNLRHILAYRYDHYTKNSFNYVYGVIIQDGFGQLEHLQTLTLVETDVGGVSFINELEKLTKLRWLGISKLTKEICTALCVAIGKMNHLQRLFLQSTDENEVLDLQYLSSPPRRLHELLLGGCLEKMPDWVPKLQNLHGLSLSFSRLIDEPAQCLKGLNNLETLSLLEKAYEGEKLHFEEGGFQKLKRLNLFKLNRLKMVQIDTGALPILERLVINSCSLLTEFPSTEHLTNLKYAVFNGRLCN